MRDEGLCSLGVNLSPAEARLLLHCPASPGELLAISR
jgi:hypothetical protein